MGAHGRAEFNIPDITFGTRYDGSPIVVMDGSVPPPDSANTYIPTGTPGGRPPHVWLGNRSLYDLLNFEWTLLRLGKQPPDAARFMHAASEVQVDLEIVDVPLDEVRAQYGAPLVLIRPDNIVAWRSDTDLDAKATMAVVTGRGMIHY